MKSALPHDHCSITLIFDVQKQRTLAPEALIFFFNSCHIKTSAAYRQDTCKLIKNPEWRLINYLKTTQQVRKHASCTENTFYFTCKLPRHVCKELFYVHNPNVPIISLNITRNGKWKRVLPVLRQNNSCKAMGYCPTRERNLVVYTTA